MNNYQYDALRRKRIIAKNLGNFTAKLHNRSHSFRNASYKISYNTSLCENTQNTSFSSTSKKQSPLVLLLQAPSQKKIPNKTDIKISNKKCGSIYAYAAKTSRGVYHHHNEDYVSIVLNFQRPTNISVIDWPQNCSFFGIFDGHGGNLCANFLKDNLHTNVFFYI